MKKVITAVIICLSNIVIAQIPSMGLGAYWPFDGNANDYSGNNNNGTVYGATPCADRFNNPNHAYKFNGSSNYILVPNSATVDMGGASDFTFAFWMKTYSGNVNAVPICKNSYGSVSGYQFFADNTAPSSYCTLSKHVSFYVATGNSDACSDSSICADSSWYFITGVYKNSTNQVFLYVNATQQADIGSSSGNRSTTSSLSFGNSTVGTQFYDGVLDGVRIYNRALSNSEILLLYNEANPTAGMFQILDLNAQISVYPNPAKDNFVVESNSVIKQTMQVYDVSGRLVLNQSIYGRTSINTSSLNEGIYTISIIGSEGRINKRLIIIR